MDKATEAVTELVTSAQRLSGLDIMCVVDIARSRKAAANSLAVIKIFRKTLSRSSGRG